MSEVKLLTEAEALEIWDEAQDRHPGPFVKALRERGLIAPEPVDPLLVEVREIAQRYGFQGNGWVTDLALAALRRGMELAPAASPLTREMLGDAIVKVFGEGESGFAGVTPNNITALHAALTGGQQ